ncbi:hypothetical protein CRM22_008406 [Opisthorchis felineus]|uniref:Uncharacterized protein n=1 Tax=Opisthorchis felineus TaxID=147828 RepID=A0A4S2LBB0_OPIFE|nr:hypothetical protein CRM22_008406 [Opisthorchis felineus]TGZ60653.1 hypothetical protein CRM22_008406 [Opisthorchis felineus]
MRLLFILCVAFIWVAKLTALPHFEFNTNITTDGAFTVQSTESKEAAFTTNVHQNHVHSTDVSTTNFDEYTGLSNGVEGRENDPTHPFQSTQSSDVYTNLKEVSGLTDHVTADPNQDFTATGASDDLNDSQTTSGFTDNVGETELDETYPHTDDAITDKFYDNSSAETSTSSTEDATTEDYLTMPGSSTVHCNTTDDGNSRISTTEYTEEGIGTEQQSTSSYSSTPFSDPVGSLISQPSTSSYKIDITVKITKSIDIPNVGN